MRSAACPACSLQSRAGAQDVRITIRGYGARGNGERSNAGNMRGIRILTDGIPTHRARRTHLARPGRPRPHRRDRGARAATSRRSTATPRAGSSICDPTSISTALHRVRERAADRSATTASRARRLHHGVRRAARPRSCNSTSTAGASTARRAPPAKVRLTGPGRRRTRSSGSASTAVSNLNRFPGPLTSAQLDARSRAGERPLRHPRRAAPEPSAGAWPSASTARSTRRSTWSSAPTSSPRCSQRTERGALPRLQPLPHRRDRDLRVALGRSTTRRRIVSSSASTSPSRTARSSSMTCRRMAGAATSWWRTSARARTPSAASSRTASTSET